MLSDATDAEAAVCLAQITDDVPSGDYDQAIAALLTALRATMSSAEGTSDACRVLRGFLIMGKLNVKPYVVCLFVFVVYHYCTI